MNETNDDNQWFWLSFADPNKLPGTQFLGAILTKAESCRDAHWKITLAGINPGGEVKFAKLDGWHPELEQHADRLLSKQEIINIFGGVVRF